MRQPACSGMLVVVLVGLGCSSPRVEDLAAEGSWELRSEGNVGDQQVTLRTTDGREERREVPAAEAGPLTLELKALPVSGVLRLGFITEKDVDAGTATLTAVDVDGAPVGWPGVFQARGGGFEGELVLSRELPRAPATASVLGEPGGVCAATRESGLAIRFDAVGSRAEVSQFARVSLDGGAGCAAALEAEAQGGGMLGAAVKQGILSASRASGLASFSTASRLIATRASTAAPAVSPLSERSIPRDVERSTPVKLRLPSTVGVGLPLAIDGHVSSTARDEDRLVTITVDPPSGPDVTLEAEASGMGRFSVTFAGTTTVGTYTITAEQTSTGTVTARDVEVVALAVAAAGADRAMEEVITVADEAVALVEDLVTALPPSPEKVEMTSRLSSFKAQVGQARTALPRITGAVERLYAPAARQPELARAVTPELQALARWADGAPRVTERWKSMLGRARMAPTICDQAEYAGEAFAALSTALNFATVARNIVKNLLVDKGLPKLVEATIPLAPPPTPIGSSRSRRPRRAWPRWTAWRGSSPRCPGWRSISPSTPPSSS